MNSRFYDTETGRFINADAYISTDQGINDKNMYIYCGNNPVSRKDQDGMFWKEIGNFFGAATKAIVNCFKAIFGAGISAVHQKTPPPTEHVKNVANLIITVKTGQKRSTNLFKKGSSSKPISVYAKGRVDKPELSSAGVKLNVANAMINMSFGLDDTGISGSIKNGYTTNSVSLTANISQFKAGFEVSTTTALKWDSDGSIITDETLYTNVSVNGWIIAAVIYMLKTGEILQKTLV